ncbi:MAG TPA: response regulator [Puia sp.]|jgi:CheY-like chemotaxis protein|nr:response regulator [Puia sp.]
MKYTKILLADDDMDDRLIFADLLSAANPDAALTFAENGLEMISLLDNTTGDDLPDIIILDQNMPRMSGKESLVFLKESQRYRHIPTFIYSTYQVNDFYRECIDLGALDVIAKPDTIQGYREMIGQFLLHPAYAHADNIQTLRCGNK